jgi:hypothetical protein
MVLIIEKALNGNQHLLARAQGRVQPWQDSTPKSLQDTYLRSDGLVWSHIWRQGMQIAAATNEKRPLTARS